MRHNAIGLNYIDVYQRTGLYSFRPAAGDRQGGRRRGRGGRRRRHRLEAQATAWRTRRARQLCEARLIAADAWSSCPTASTTRTAAAMMLKGMTAQYLLRRTYPVKRGDDDPVPRRRRRRRPDRLPVGQGARRDRDRHRRLRREGARSPRRTAATHVIDYTREDFVARVKEITGGKGVPVVYDSVGKDTFPGSLDCLRRAG